MCLLACTPPCLQLNRLCVKACVLVVLAWQDSHGSVSVEASEPNESKQQDIMQAYVAIVCVVGDANVCFVRACACLCVLCA
jgi:hypothetical protein